MPISLTREQLYERVWAEPIDRLCKEFGLSNVGLRKVCIRHDIPVPPRGYWARRQHGQRVHQPPLPPKDKAGIGTIHFRDKPVPIAPPEQEPESVHPLVAFERQAQNAIDVQDTLQARHPLVRATRVYWAAVKRHEVKYGENKLPHLNVRVSRPSEARALRLMHALLTACDQRGFDTSATPEGKTTVKVLEVVLELSLRERLRQQPHKPTEKELQEMKQWSWSRPPKFDQIHSGEFELKLENVWGTKHTWNDGKRHRLEQLLNDVIEGMVRAALLEHDRQAARERERLAAEESARRKAEVERRRQQERARIRHLEELMIAADQFDRARAFMSRLRDAVGDTAPDSDLGQWLRWAQTHVDSLEPFGRFRNRQDTITLYFPVRTYDVDAVLQHGFRDRAATHSQEGESALGVILHDVPVSYGSGSTYLVVTIPEEAVLTYERYGADEGLGRQFQVPASVLNARGTVARA